MPDTNRQAYLQAMGIDVWVRRDLPQVDEPDVSEPVPVNDPGTQVSAATDEQINPADDLSALDLDALDLDALRNRVAECTLCELHETRTQTVFGVGNPNADWLIIGEAPGADEDRQGEPFVGRAGKLLNAMLKAIGFEREQVYIANILKCRPPRNRDPKPEEAACCSLYLRRQIEIIQPSLILAVGRIAAQRLLKTDSALGRLRGKVHHYEDTDIPLVVTYHPAYLLRSPGEKRKAWEDLQFAQRVVNKSVKVGHDDEKLTEAL